MFRFKACQRCQGDLHVEQNELDDEEARCMQCGYRSFGTAGAAVVAFDGLSEAEMPQAA